MDKQKIMNEVVKIMNAAGIDMDKNGIPTQNIMDNISSLTIMSVFVRLENVFKISLPDQFIKIDTLQNAEALTDLIFTLKYNDEK